MDRGGWEATIKLKINIADRALERERHRRVEKGGVRVTKL